MKNLIPISVTTIAFDDQLIILDSDEARVEVHLKKQETFVPSLEVLKAEGFDSEILQLHLADTLEGEVEDLNKQLSVSTEKVDILQTELSKTQNDFISQSQLLAKTQDDLVTANEKIAALEAVNVQPAPAPQAEPAPAQ